MTQLRSELTDQWWCQWRAVCAEKHSWHVFSMNRLYRSNETGRWPDWDGIREMARVRAYLDGVASLLMAKVAFAEAGFEVSQLSVPETEGRL
ncbi:hypothetical protein GIY23_01930 [Allosaccharopolyspora coralli]|uniref:Uncharacterized protein n=1 Tax=Allosaccharopolyspora coralli TaxID=2665642 RepID=A0A5Q3Q1M0_9PSEU|nr:hypothetical protein [Allosaccharopolyspora coralli]QGK68478.1 hypothetical protein GIY23_01930 [Allosaccharopolyspora coralli]